MADRSLVLIKPDAVERHLIGEILLRFERKGFAIVAMELRTLDVETAKTHYAEHAAKPFFGELVEFITSGPLVALVLEGEQAVPAIRVLVGATNGAEADPGSIRGTFGLSKSFNMVHASDSPEAAAREIALFFPNL